MRKPGLTEMDVPASASCTTAPMQVHWPIQSGNHETGPEGTW